jgi:hypothetical protein
VTGDDAKVTTARFGADPETAHFLQALESMAKAELAFAKRMRGMGPKLEALARTGHELEARVHEDFGKFSEMKATEVKGELTASFDVLDKISASATRTARDAEFLIADLQRAVAATGIGTAPVIVVPSAVPSASASVSGSASAAASASKPPPPVTPRPTPPLAPRPTTTTAPAPPPARPTGGGEVFNP